MSLIPVRGGNGALELLAADGLFEPPSMSQLEQALEATVERDRGVVQLDLWDLEKHASCSACLEQRRRRLGAMNLDGVVRAPIACEACAGSHGAGEPE